MLALHIFGRGVGGIPSSSTVTNLADRVMDYTHTISNAFGFESMTCSFPTTLDGAMDWLGDGLGRSVVVYGPDAEIVWEGFLETITATIGGETRSVSLRDMANRVRVRYTSVLGTAATIATASDTISQAKYGIKDAVLTLNESDSTEAGHYQTTMLAKLKNPLSGPSATAATGEAGAVQLSLSFAGWYATLDWLLTSNTSTTKTSTTTQVGTLLAAYNAVNAFFASATNNITSSGITAVEYIEQDTSYRQKIEALLKRGNGTNPYAWGVYEGRTFFAKAYAGATPTSIDYQRRIGEPFVRDAAGGIINAWNVRPDTNYRAVDLLDVAPISTAQDSAAQFYVARTTCSINSDSVSVTLEPDESTDLSAVLITKYV